MGGPVGGMSLWRVALSIGAHDGSGILQEIHRGLSLHTYDEDQQIYCSCLKPQRHWLHLQEVCHSSRIFASRYVLW